MLILILFAVLFVHLDGVIVRVQLVAGHRFWGTI